MKKQFLPLALFIAVVLFSLLLKYLEPSIDTETFDFIKKTCKGSTILYVALTWLLDAIAGKKLSITEYKNVWKSSALLSMAFLLALILSLVLFANSYQTLSNQTYLLLGIELILILLSYFLFRKKPLQERAKKGINVFSAALLSYFVFLFIHLLR